jgi:hypothetical protein
MGERPASHRVQLGRPKVGTWHPWMCPCSAGRRLREQLLEPLRPRQPALASPGSRKCCLRQSPNGKVQRRAARTGEKPVVVGFAWAGCGIPLAAPARPFFAVPAITWRRRKAFRYSAPASGERQDDEHLRLPCRFCRPPGAHAASRRRPAVPTLFAASQKHNVAFARDSHTPNAWALSVERRAYPLRRPLNSYSFPHGWYRKATVRVKDATGQNICDLSH